MLSNNHKSFRLLGVQIAVLALAIFAGSSLWAAEDNAKADEGQAAAVPAAPAAPAAAAADPFVVPDGTPAELEAYIKRIATVQPPQTQDMQTVMAFLKKSRTAIAEAAEKMLLSPDASAEQRKQALGLKLVALSQLMQLGDAGAEARLKAVPEELEKLGMKEEAEMVRGQLLQLELQQAVAGGPGSPALEPTIQKFKDYVAKKGDPMSFQMAVGLLSQLEMQNKSKIAVELCNDLVEIYKKSKDPLKDKILERLEGVSRRLNLVGGPMVITGKTADGKSFDWKAFQKDKVVLVDFWATWCAPCVQLMPHLEELYSMYNEKGFEILGISLDEDQKTMNDFLAQKKLPWTTLFDGVNGAANQDPKAEVPNAIYYAINAVPFTALVDQKGNVVGVNLQGPALMAALEKLLGPPAKVEKKPGVPAQFDLKSLLPQGGNDQQK